MWRESDKDVMTLTIPENCKEFTDYYDALQEKICQISVLDELLAGIHSVVIIAVPSVCLISTQEC